ncbi:hypothetical protein GCM10025857_36660 [Alicyclobacillus contaminans]|nr:hypothetical protein GCM10025857_36660 [Alicyclobacillus contaminans]
MRSWLGRWRNVRVLVFVRCVVSRHGVWIRVVSEHAVSPVMDFLGLFAAASVWLFARIGFELSIPEWILYAVSLAGALAATWMTTFLRKSGYALFSK